MGAEGDTIKEVQQNALGSDIKKNRNNNSQLETNSHAEHLYYWLPIGVSRVYYGHPIGPKEVDSSKWLKKWMCGKARWP
jgi:hypothetical protein